MLLFFLPVSTLAASLGPMGPDAPAREPQTGGQRIST